MGSGDEEDEEDEGVEEEELLIINQCPILRLRSVQVPNAPCPIPNPQFNIDSCFILFLTPYSPLPTPHSPLPILLLLQTC
ncbi:hypothetical protein [Nostoc sp. CHAB 5715]|uniref:hypothetical protein n=1 Tax=Nostoc sp. CHAB 5715 TaxID=2780400 RepID=UPI001E64EF30|nr:hypothetical protein [Nostoc sp. CHAB 5715]MCC5623535.1 hypothetical protein [Nostoc sp. CHAB 5715]